MSANGVSYYRQAVSIARDRRMPKRFRTDLTRHDKRALLALAPEVERIGWVLYGKGTHLATLRQGQRLSRDTAETLLDFLRYGGGSCYVGECGVLREVSATEFVELMTEVS